MSLCLCVYVFLCGVSACVLVYVRVCLSVRVCCTCFRVRPKSDRPHKRNGTTKQAQQVPSEKVMGRLWGLHAPMNSKPLPGTTGRTTPREVRSYSSVDKRRPPFPFSRIELPRWKQWLPSLLHQSDHMVGPGTNTPPRATPTGLGSLTVQGMWELS